MGLVNIYKYLNIIDGLMNPHEHVESFRPIESQNYYYILSEFDLKRMLLLGDMSQCPFCGTRGSGVEGQL